MPRHRRRLERDPLRALFCEAAASQGVLLAYLDGDPETVRRVETYAGVVLAVVQQQRSGEAEEQGREY